MCMTGFQFSRAAAAVGVPARTARHWRAAYEAEGSAGSVRIARTNRGGRRIPAELVTLIEGMALRRPPPRAAEDDGRFTTLVAGKGWPAPSYPGGATGNRQLGPGFVTLADHHHFYLRPRTKCSRGMSCA